MSQNKFKMTTPVAFIIFNRPDLAKLVFAEIAKVRPPKLLVIGDGPRLDRPNEPELVAQSRAIIKQVDWDCEVLTNYADANMGCKMRVSSGLDWVFEQVDEAIILEDDCLPDESFFQFCQELLEMYRYDERVAIISGNNFQLGRHRTNASYYFSRYNHIWGWASWRRAWKYYDRELEIWPQVLNSNALSQLTFNRREYAYWAKAFQGVYDGTVDTWDVQWTFAIFIRGMLNILPSVNLIKNIGFGPQATHTKGPSIYENIGTESMAFPLTHPILHAAHYGADKYTAETMFSSSLLVRIVRKIRAYVLKVLSK
jgi:hypothetical protein